MGQVSHPHVFINKVLLEHCHYLVFTYILYVNCIQCSHTVYILYRFTYILQVYKFYILHIVKLLVSYKSRISHRRELTNCKVQNIYYFRASLLPRVLKESWNINKTICFDFPVSLVILTQNLTRYLPLPLQHQ